MLVIVETKCIAKYISSTQIEMKYRNIIIYNESISFGCGIKMPSDDFMIDITDITVCMIWAIHFGGG